MDKKRYFTKITMLLMFSAVIFFQSCNLKQTLYIDKNSAGSVSFELTLADYFTDVAEQLSDLMPDDADNKLMEEGFFDLDKIREDFSKDLSVNLDNLSSPSPQLLKGSISFDDVTKVFTGENGINGNSMFSFSKNGNLYKLSLEVNYDTMESMLAANPSLNSPLMENFGPLANSGLSDEDYLDMMEFVLGNESRAGIRDSRLIMDVNVEGTVVESEGGRMIDNDTVRFEIPLLRILILDEPQVFSVTFKE